MFYAATLERQVDVEPKMFGPNLVRNIKEKVRSEAQGMVDPSVGYIVFVSDVHLLGKGLIRADGSGLATFNVQYQCIAMRLWEDEVVDAVVVLVTNYGLKCKVGPYHIFVSEKNMPDEYILRNVNNQDVWASEAEALEIKEDSHIRIRIKNIQLQPEKLGGVATMKGDYLGVLNMP